MNINAIELSVEELAGVSGGDVKSVFMGAMAALAIKGALAGAAEGVVVLTGPTGGGNKGGGSGITLY